MEWILIDSNSPVGQDLSDPGSWASVEHAKTYESLKRALKTTTVAQCTVRTVGAVQLSQGSLETAVSLSLSAVTSTKTGGACLLCALATVCFIALFRPRDLCATWHQLLHHCLTPAGESSAI